MTSKVKYPAIDQDFISSHRRGTISLIADDNCSVDIAYRNLTDKEDSFYQYLKEHQVSLYLFRHAVEEYISAGYDEMDIMSSKIIHMRSPKLSTQTVNLHGQRIYQLTQEIVIELSDRHHKLVHLSFSSRKPLHLKDNYHGTRSRIQETRSKESRC